MASDTRTTRDRSQKALEEAAEMSVVEIPVAREALPREVVEEVALDIGKEVASHIETMYPDAVRATSKSMLRSLRNSVYNDIMAAVEALERGDAEAWLAQRQVSRKAIRAQWRKSRVCADVLDGEPIDD